MTSEETTGSGFIQKYAIVWFMLTFGLSVILLITMCMFIYLLRIVKKQSAPRILKWPVRTVSNTQLIVDGDKDGRKQDGKSPLVDKNDKKNIKKLDFQKDTKQGGYVQKIDAKEKDKFQIPVGDKIVNRKDPNYQSLKGIPNDIFDKKDEINVVQEEKIKRYEYETLENIEKEDKEDKKGAENELKKPKFRPPDKVKKVASKNPQYETLAGIDDQLFKKKEEFTLNDTKKSNQKVEEKDAEEKAAIKDEKPKKVTFKRPQMIKVSAKNPQYETFADVSDDIFKGDKK